MNIVPVEYQSQRILTTQQIAEGYGVEAKKIVDNFGNNRARYQIGVHYFFLEGDALRAFKHDTENIGVLENADRVSKLYLWTERGALLHAKSLNTDKAWEVYGDLVENYFTKQQILDLSQLPPEMQMFKHVFDVTAKLCLEAAETKKQLTATTEKVAAVENTLTLVKDTIIQRDEDWRKWMNDMFNAAVLNSPSKDFQALRHETYEILEQRAGCDLSRRLRFMRSRLAESGATKTKINGVTRVDVIESDKRIKEIYTGIVKELSIRYMPAG